MFRLDNKIAVITGGGSGIGQAIALLFARQGATVCLIELSHESAQSTLQLIHTEGYKAKVFPCNVADHEAVLAVFEQIGHLDILVNNAGIAHIGNVENTGEADFDRVMSVNVKGVFNCIKAAIPQLKSNGGGVILNMASIGAWVGLGDRLAYSTSKGAVAAMTLSVAKDYLAANIRCNSMSPARIHTPFVDGFLDKTYPDNKAEMFEKLSKSQPIGRMGTPKEVAALALYLCSDEAGFVTGCDYPLDGGFIKLNG